jgi:hypothetical protein
MDAAAYCRARAKEVRQLAETTLEDALRESLRAMARDYDELAEDLDNGATAVRHPDLLPEWYPNSSARHRRHNRLTS